jgi:hypothetical protein
LCGRIQRRSWLVPTTEVGHESRNSDKNRNQCRNSRQQIVLLLLDSAKVAETSTGQRRPLWTNDLLSAVAAKIWTVEHDQFGNPDQKEQAWNRLVIWLSIV